MFLTGCRLQFVLKLTCSFLYFYCLCYRRRIKRNVTLFFPDLFLSLLCLYMRTTLILPDKKNPANKWFAGFFNYVYNDLIYCSGFSMLLWIFGVLPVSYPLFFHQTSDLKTACSFFQIQSSRTRSGLVKIIPLPVNTRWYLSQKLPVSVHSTIAW